MPPPQGNENCAGQNEKHFCTALLMSFQLNDCYRPQTKLQEGNDFTPVCHSIYRGGEYDVTFCFLRRIISLPVWSHVPSGGRVWSQNLHLVAATEAGGMHPTGMHSCL